MKIFMSIFAIIAVLAVGFVPNAVTASVPKVSGCSVSQMDYSRSVYCSGQLSAATTKEIYLNAPAIPSEVKVEVGDRVEKGQVLAVIDQELSRAVIAQGEYQEVLTGIEQLLDGNNQELLEKYAAALGISGMDAATLAQILAGSASLSSASGDRISYADNYLPKNITAPISGVITSLNLYPDILCKSNQPLVTVADLSSYTALVSVNESSAELVKVGDKVEITVSALNNESYEGEVTKVYPTARKSTGSLSTETVVDVEIAISNPDDRLKAGYTVKAEIFTEEERAVVAVPYEAVEQDSRNQEYVYVLENSRAVRKNITTGAEFADHVEVISGLSSQDVVITDPQAIRQDNDIVLFSISQDGQKTK